MPRLFSALQLGSLQGMESPATADEADDSYRTLGVGRSLSGSHDIKQRFTRMAAKAAWACRAWSNVDGWEIFR